MTSRRINSLQTSKLKRLSTVIIAYTIEMTGIYKTMSHNPKKGTIAS